MKVIETLRFMIFRRLRSKPEAKDLLTNVHNRLQQVVPIDTGAPIDDTYDNFLDERAPVKNRSYDHTIRRQSSNYKAEKRRIEENCKRTIASMRYIICRQMKNPTEAKNLLSSVSEYLQQNHNFGPTSPLQQLQWNTCEGLSRQCAT
ncbi:hypothetical protein niasHS_002002 [Heterodera schachtii]|uniref:Uncharacterized protein n=1 Tax=Heterodera schachtii TaxID=97005 RepID=A0ABD2K5J7_HETSC